MNWTAMSDGCNQDANGLSCRVVMEDAIAENITLLTSRQDMWRRDFCHQAPALLAVGQTYVILELNKCRL